MMLKLKKKMIAMIIRFYLLLNFFLCFSSILLSQEITQENVARVVVNGVELTNPFGGGLNAPQLSNVDFNNDGVSDVLIFDRIGGVIMPMIRGSEGLTYEASYIDNFPQIEHFLLMLDYNADGIV